MTGYTPKLQLPYAQPTDALATWPATSQELATKLDNQLEFGWMFVHDAAAVSLSSGVWTKLNTTIYHEGGGTGVVYSGAGGLVAQVAGLYVIEALLEFAFNANGARMMGVGPGSGSQPYQYLRTFIPAVPTTSTLTSISGSWTYRLAAGDNFHMWAQQTTGGTISTAARRFGMRRVAP